MSIRLISAFLILIAVSSAYSYERPVRLKNGRQYVKSLSLALNVSMHEYRPRFDAVKMNLPKSGELSEFYAAKDSMAKLASFGCDVLDFMQGPGLSVEGLYLKILKRNPTDAERQSVILVNGKFQTYANCLVLTMHPEFILITK